ncbi:MAG: Mur ligase family protein [Rhodothermales bacterium]
MTLSFDDSRRLTGPNLFSDRPGAVLQAAVEDVPIDRVVSVWERHARRLLDALGWADSETFSKPFEGGAHLGFTAPYDALYAATEVNEAAWQAAAAALTDADAPDDAATVETLRAAIAAERAPGLLALRSAAAERGLAFLPDDEFVTVGMGTGSRTWPADALPHPSAVDWGALHDVPVGLVTGTNGKSTTVRLVAAIANAAGRTAGQCSTDFVRVGDEVVERGDWSGPGGARAVLRDPRVEVAVLETARGGLLRRGLALDRATAAVVTNVAEDHLGDYGITSLDGLIEAKLIVRRAVERDGLLLLNADDAGLVRWAASYGGALCWFSLDADDPTLAAHRRAGGTVCFVDGGEIVYASDGERTALLPVSDVPLTLGGAARYNVSNALAAVALAFALDLSADAVRTGLRSFRSDAHDNPGRGNVFSIGGARILVDFAHNQHGAAAVAEAARALPAERRLVLLSQPGDRTDREIQRFARAAWGVAPDHIIIAEIPTYLRGRAPGEIPALIDDELHRHGATEEHITHVADPVEGVRLALDWMAPGDLLLLFVLSHRNEVFALLHEAQAHAG